MAGQWPCVSVGGSWGCYQPAFLSGSQHSLYVGAPSGVIQLPLSSCSRYHSCYDCILARDPYCGWDPGTHACIVFSRSQSSR